MSGEEAPIIYADLYRVTGVGVVITGFGKSRAGRLAAEMKPDNCLAADFVEFERHGRIVVARATERARRHEARALGGCYSSTWERVLVFARCLREDETVAVYGQEPRLAKPIRPDQIERAFGYPVISLAAERDRDERLLSFIRLIAEAECEFVFLPWCESSEAKGLLLRDYVARAAATNTGLRSGGHLNSIPSG